MIIDEFLLTTMTNEQANDQLEVIEPRVERTSIISAPSLDRTVGHEWIGPPEYETLCDAAIDRLSVPMLMRP